MWENQMIFGSELRLDVLYKSIFIVWFLVWDLRSIFRKYFSQYYFRTVFRITIFRSLLIWGVSSVPIDFGRGKQNE